MDFPVSAETVRQAVTDYGITHLPHHDCSICGQWVKYVFTENTIGQLAPFFDSNCGCSDRWSPRIAHSWSGVAEFINQADPAAAQAIWDRMMAQATKQPATPSMPIGILGRAGGMANGNPVISITRDEVHRWLRSVADAHGLKGELLVVQFGWTEGTGDDAHEEIRSDIPALHMMVRP